MIFESLGPFPFDRSLSSECLEELWDSVEERWTGLPNAIGCYVFCLDYRNRKMVPWYVGKTTNQAGFRREAFEKHKVALYRTAFDKRPNHSPFMFLFPLMDSRWGLATPGTSKKKARDVKKLETVMIGMALSKNRELLNTSETSFLRGVYVNQVIGPQDRGRPSDDATKAKQLLT